MICRRCHGTGWQCEEHPAQPRDHLLPNGEKCAGPFEPCREPRCPDSGTLRDWRSLMKNGDEAAERLDRELEQLAQRVLETFGQDVYTAAVIKANVIGRQKPNNPRFGNLALRDE